jgi:HK97 family phage prohead protease
MSKTIKRETKVTAFIPTSIDEDQGLVDHIVTVFGIVDEGNDVSHPGAFSKTIAERAGRIRVLDMHNQGSIFSAIGVPKRLWEVGRSGLPQKVQAEWPEATGGLMATTQFLMDTPEGKGAFSRIKAGAINEFSYTYDCLDSEYGKAKNHDGKMVTVRNLKTVRLWEYSPVVWGMNQATGVVDAKKLGGSEGKPYIKVKEGDEWVVYKEDADKKPVGDPLGKHPTEEAADEQLAALYASMKDEGKAAEALEDAMKGVGVAFNAQFTDGSAETYAMPTAPWVLKTYDTYIIAEYEGKVYKVNYRGTEGQYDFDTRDAWVEVEQAWQPVSTGAPEPEVTADDSHVDPNVPGKARKYSEDQERDELGRFGAGGGGGGEGSGGSGGDKPAELSAKEAGKVEGNIAAALKDANLKVSGVSYMGVSPDGGHMYSVAASFKVTSEDDLKDGGADLDREDAEKGLTDTIYTAVSDAIGMSDGEVVVEVGKIEQVGGGVGSTVNVGALVTVHMYDEEPDNGAFNMSGRAHRVHKAGRVLAARNVARITGAVQALAEALSEVGVIIKVEAQAATEAPADDADEPKAGKAAGPNPQGSPTTTDAERLRLIEVGIAELDLL